jgi:hypothetical protein
LDRNLSEADRTVLSEEKARVAKELALKHYEVEEERTRIFRLIGADDVETRPAEPVKLLDVNEHSFPSGARPLQFAAVPASGIPFPSVIVEVTPDEFAKIQLQELRLPRGWRLGEELVEPLDAVGAA